MGVTELKVSREVSLPKNAATQKLAFLGNSGSGKTYATGVFVERLLDHRAQVVVIDTVGNWWGLRLSAGGKRPSGYRIPILGGDHGDVSLEPSAGKLTAEVIAETKSSMVVDISDFTVADQRRFMVDLATTLLSAKKRAPSPMMMVVEECQDIVPQWVRGEDAKMVGAMQRLVKRGRNYGVGVTLISQRPAAVNKDVLNLVETVFAFRMTGTHDRVAISKWVENNAQGATALIAELPKLETGTCFVWSPSWLKEFRLIHISNKRTFDSTATPDFDVKTVSKTLAPVDLAKFKKRMAEAIETAKDHDPNMLKARIVELETQVAKKEKPVAAKPVETIVEKPVMSRAMVLAFERSLKRGEKMADRITESTVDIAAAFAKAAESMGRELAALRTAFESFKTIALATPVPAKVFTTGTTWTKPTPPVQKVTAVYDGGGPTSKVGPAGRSTDDPLPTGERAVLTALIQFPNGLTGPEISVMTGYKQQTRDTYISRLSDRGLAQRDRPGHAIATFAGRAALPDIKSLPTGAALRDHWLRELPSGEGHILAFLLQAKGADVTRAAITEATAYKQQTRDTYLSRMIAKHIVEDRGRGVVGASPTLFGG